MRSVGITPLLAAPLVGFALLSMAVCGVSGGSGSPDGAAAAASGAVAVHTGGPGVDAPTTASLTTVESDLGAILVDTEGRTRHGFTEDEQAAATCDAGCVAVRPALPFDLSDPSDLWEPSDSSAKDITAVGAADPALLNVHG
ncbi:hypothetical protein ABZ208_00550 [Streptomyces sp. NPDC006208]|uniref:hypothetical protein n=1 Tax=Streptomyces sp. NPDC006208 TaxID=3156734 RepID=UPI0033B345D7